MPYPYAQVRIYSEESIESVAGLLSERLFGGVAFGDRELELFEDVPALRLLGTFLGLFVAIHGQKGEYVLLMQPTPQALRVQDASHVDISDYVAELARAISSWRVEVPKV